MNLIKKILSEFFTQLTEARLLHAKFLRKTENLEVTYKKCKMLYSASSRAMSDLLSTFYVKYDQISVSVGVILMAMVCAIISGEFVKYSTNWKSIDLPRY